MLVCWICDNCCFLSIIRFVIFGEFYAALFEKMSCICNFVSIKFVSSDKLN